MGIIKFFILLLSANLLLAATMPNYDKEARWAQQVESDLFDGEIITISGADKDFIGIFMESSTKSNKAAIIIHGLGVHPDWAGVINPLRISLTDKKYNTLSIQMPVLANGVIGEEYIGLLPISDKRIANAVNYLEEEGFVVDMIVAHSLGTTMASNYIANVPNPINKYIAIGANSGSIDNMKKINIKMLDLYGDQDINGVLSTNEKRQEAASHNKNYVQQMAVGDHFFSGNNDNLINAVNSWLDNHE